MSILLQWQLLLFKMRPPNAKSIVAKFHFIIIYMFFIWYRNLILANFIIYVYETHFKELESQSLLIYPHKNLYLRWSFHFLFYCAYISVILFAGTCMPISLVFFYSSRRCYYNNMNHVMMYYIQAPFGLRSMFTRLCLPLFFSL